MRNYITVAEVISIYQALEKRLEIIPCAPRDIGLIELILARPEITNYPDILAETAVIAEGFINSRPFVQLNTATAFAITCILLEINHFKLSCTPNLANQTWSQWGKKFTSWNEIHQWLTLVAEPTY